MEKSRSIYHHSCTLLDLDSLHCVFGLHTQCTFFFNRVDHLRLLFMHKIRVNKSTFDRVSPCYHLAGYEPRVFVKPYSQVSV